MLWREGKWYNDDRADSTETGQTIGKMYLCPVQKILIKNIRALFGAREICPDRLKGPEMADGAVLEDAWLAIEDGLIADFGSMKDWPGISDWRDLEVIDAEGSAVLPGWADSHTHLVYAGSRESEFTDRIRGLSYQEIAARGGGILNSAAKLADTPEEVLFEQALIRAKKAMDMGTLAFEIKSGYGLEPEAELKMLRVIRRLRDSLPVPVKATFLGAHAVPARFKGDADAYMREVLEVMLPEVAAQQLADYTDIFCEAGYFHPVHLKQLAEASAKYGLRCKVHVNQFQSIGGVKAAVESGCLSADHLEVLNAEDLEALRGSDTMPVALPGCSLFLGIPYTPGRAIIDGGMPLALATDCNPGSAPSFNMNLVVSLACIAMKLLPAEAINAATLNAAAAMELSAEMGSITPGKKARIIITEPVSGIDFLPYSFGENLVKRVLY